MGKIIDFKNKQQSLEVMQRLEGVGQILHDIVEALDKGYMHMDNMEMQYEQSQNAFELILYEAAEKIGVENIPISLLEQSREVGIHISDDGIFYEWGGKKWKRPE